MSGSFVDRILAFLSHNSGAKIISVIIALVLWIVVLGSRTVEVTKDVALEIQTPTGTVVANDVPDKISFRLAGPKAFLRAILDRREEPIRVNLSGAKPGLVTYRFFSDNIELPIGVKVLSATPPSIIIKLETLKKKEVPVRVELKGRVPEGYQITRTEVKPTVVKIRGPESMIESLSEAPTLPIDLTTLKEDLSTRAPLDLARHGLELEGAAPQIFIEVRPIQANFKIKNVEVRVNSKHRAKLDEGAVTVYVRLDPAEIGKLDRKMVYAEVDLQDKNKGRHTEKIKVVLPPGVGLVRVVPEQVTVTLY